MKQWSVNCGRRVVAPGVAHRAIDAVDRQEGEAVGAHEAAHLLEVHARGEQLVALGRVDAVEIGMGDRRRGDAEMHLARARVAHHLHDLHAGGAAHDRIVDQHDALALDDGAVGVVLEAHAELADRLRRLDEGAADVMVADDAELERHAAGGGVAERRGHAGIGHRHDDVGVGRRFPRQLRAHRLARVVDRAAVHDRVGPGEIDVFEDARPHRLRRERLQAPHAARVDDDHLAVLDVAHELGADDVERAGLRAAGSGSRRVRRAPAGGCRADRARRSASCWSARPAHRRPRSGSARR